MFRILFFAIIALRVIFCPLFCAAGAVGTHCETAKPDCCCESTQAICCDQSDSRDSDPAQSNDSCCAHSNCQIQVDLNQRVVKLFDLKVFVEPLSVTNDVAEQYAATAHRDLNSLHLLCDSGRSIRLVYSSLLL